MSMRSHEQFGGTLLTKSGIQNPADALRGKAVVGIYFSAHWCPPCRQFTPWLVDVYNRVRAEHGKDALEVVFVSGDNDEASFNEYYSEMPWTVVPYLGAASIQLNNLYKHSGIPFLVLLDAEGRKLTDDGRALLTKYGASAYPWSTKAVEASIASRCETAKAFKPLFANGGELKCKGSHSIEDASGFGGRHVAVVRCVTQGQERGYMDQIMIPMSKVLSEKVAFCFLCADKGPSGMAGLVKALPDGWFYVEHGSVAAQGGLDFYSTGDIGLVCCAADGAILSEDMLAESAELGADAFPWSPEAIEAARAAKEARMAAKRKAVKDFQCFGSKLVSKDGDVEPGTAFADKEYVMIYFSAHWCPPCRAFTPELVNRYKELKASGVKFDIVFCSSDHDEAAFNEYFGEMPWLALPYSQGLLKQELSDMFGVEGIPTLVICSKDGKVNTEGCSAVMEGPASWISLPSSSRL